MTTTEALAPAKIPWHRRPLRVAKRVLRAVVIAYLLASIAVYFLQEYLIFPGASSHGTPEAQVRPGGGEELVRLTAADGVPVVGLFAQADAPRMHETSRFAPGVPRPTVLYFYGNGECMDMARTVSDKFRALGYPCMLVEYEGYGMSGGKPGEQGCYAAAEAAYQYVLKRPEVDTHKLIVAGWSLGGAMAIDLAQRHRAEGTICALMTFSSFTSMVDVGKHHYGFLPVSLALKHRFMSIEKIGTITVPYFNGHGRQDSIVPFKLSSGLTSAYGGSGKLTTFVSESDHNDFFEVDGERLTKEIAQFLQGVTTPALFQHEEHKGK